VPGRVLGTHGKLLLVVIWVGGTESLGTKTVYISFGSQANCWGTFVE